MALVFGAAVVNGPYTKIVTLTETDNAAVNELAVVYAANGMTNLSAAPVDPGITVSAATGLNVTSQFSIVAMTAAGFTIRKTSAGLAADAIVVRVVMRVIHPLDQ
jgi:hypothetical protein